jgi:dimethylamine monooxygenase subunit A
VERVDPRRFAVDVDRYRHADHSWLDELDHLAVHAGPPYQRMGTRGVAAADWFVADEHRPAELALRRRLLAEVPAEVLAVTPGSEAACTEAAAMLRSWLDAWDDGVAHPLARAALAVQDDLAVMERRDGRWLLTAGAILFPSYWCLADKIGRPQLDVHGPVPHYEGDLAERVDRFFDRLSPERIIGRRNWGFVAHPLMFVPGADAVEHPVEFDLDQLWMRSERQTLRRLPVSGAVLFSIRVQQAPARAVAARPEVAARVLDAMEQWTPELIRSRGGRHGWFPQVVAWLRAELGR